MSLLTTTSQEKQDKELRDPAEDEREKKESEETDEGGKETENKTTMSVNRDVVTGNPWTRLLNGQRAEVIKVSRPDLIGGVGIKIKQIEERAAADATEVDIADPKAAEVIDEQLRESHVRANEVSVLTAIFRAYGSDIWMLKKIDRPGVEGDEERGLDPKQMGNRTDLDDGLVFVIAGSRADEMKQLFASPPAVSGGELPQPFDIEPRWNYLGNEGFTVKYRHPDSTRISEIRFLYARDKDGSETGEKEGQSPNDSSTADTLAEIKKAA